MDFSIDFLRVSLDLVTDGVQLCNSLSMTDLVPYWPFKNDFSYSQVTDSVQFPIQNWFSISIKDSKIGVSYGQYI